MSAYYNEFDPFAAAWLRELIKAGLIADGEDGLSGEGRAVGAFGNAIVPQVAAEFIKAAMT